MLAQQIKEELNTFKMVCANVDEYFGASLLTISGNGSSRTIQDVHPLFLTPERHVNRAGEAPDCSLIGIRRQFSTSQFRSAVCLRIISISYQFVYQAACHFTHHQIQTSCLLLWHQFCEYLLQELLGTGIFGKVKIEQKVGSKWSTPPDSALAHHPEAYIAFLRRIYSRKVICLFCFGLVKKFAYKSFLCDRINFTLYEVFKGQAGGKREGNGRQQMEDLFLFSSSPACNVIVCGMVHIIQRVSECFFSS